MQKPMTTEELIAHDGISPEDKALIEEEMGQHSDSTKGSARVNALRGYLVSLWEEMEPDDTLRRDLAGMAASWSDGWSYCLKYRKPE